MNISLIFLTLIKSIIIWWKFYVSEYEIGKIEGMDDDEDIEDGSKDEDEPPAKRGRGRPPKNPNLMMPTKNTLQSLLANMGYPGMV